MAISEDELVSRAPWRHDRILLIDLQSQCHFNESLENHVSFFNKKKDVLIDERDSSAA